uniref:target of Nesh-SH3-like n=1 Tax=Pristiophorus japonicus TaxID=55135 RepID=UPI00398F124F
MRSGTPAETIRMRILDTRGKIPGDEDHDSQHHGHGREGVQTMGREWWFGQDTHDVNVMEHVADNDLSGYLPRVYCKAPPKCSRQPKRCLSPPIVSSASFWLALIADESYPNHKISKRKLHLSQLLRKMSVKFIFVIFGGIVLTLVDNARILPRVKRQSLRVRITAKDDSIVLQYLSSSPAIKLQGYVLGYGGRYTKQNISLPDNGDPFEVDVEFNPKYLIAVHPVAEQTKAALGKKCKGNLDLHKPPQITIDTRTPTSVFLTWAHSLKGTVYKNVGHECGDERHYTVRYREKEKNKKWLYQCCPTSETMIDNLKPNTVYEFGVRVTKAKENGIWSKPTSYFTTVTSSPTSTENDQGHKVSKKFAVTFNNGNPKNSRKHENGAHFTKIIMDKPVHNRKP